MFAASRPRAVVIGLDGLSHSLAQRLCKKESLPSLSTLVNSPDCYPIQAELPELSPVNWTSFFTAAGPGQHGIYGFTRIDPSSYDISFTDSGHVCRPTIFDNLGGKGLISRIINLPHTYPVSPINGMVIAGFSAPEMNRAVYPPYLKPMLLGQGYKLEADTVQGARDHDFLLSELHAALAGREKALEMFWPDLSWDVFVFVLTETDRIGHFLFPALLDEDHPLHRDCMSFLRRWDGVIGKVLERFEMLPGPKMLLSFADHGFTELVQEVDINTWLKKHGFCSLASEPAHELDASSIGPASKAFALDPGRIYIHSRDRFSRGGVSSKETGAVRQNIIEGLMSLTYEDRQVMEHIYTREELYGDPCFGQAPDLVCLAKPGFDLKAKFNREDVFGYFGRSGCHIAGDVFCYHSQGTRLQQVRQTGEEILNFFAPDTKPKIHI